MMQSNWKNIYFQHFYGHFKSHLRRASDRSAIFLTDLAGRTVKESSSPIGPGFESRRRRQKGHRSIVSINSSKSTLFHKIDTYLKISYMNKNHNRPMTFLSPASGFEPGTYRTGQFFDSSSC